jgi:hypothetical protein
MLTVVAFVVFHDNVADCPCVIEAGRTVSEAMGGAGVTVSVAVAVAVPVTLVAVNVYVVVTLGLTLRVPVAPTTPMP